MKLVKTAFFSSILTATRISSGFVASKVVALLTGPAGVALLGAFSNFISVTLTFANGAINNGVVKYTSEYQDDESQLKSLISTSVRISFFCSALTGAVLLCIAPYLAVWLLKSDQYTTVIRVLGLTIILYSLNTLLICILNGMGQIKLYTIVNTVGSIIGLIFTITLVYYFKIAGALYALVLAPSIVFFVTAVSIVKSPWFNWGYFMQPFNKIIGSKLGHYSLMAIVTALTVPISQIVLRNIIISKVGINSAGYWQAVMRVSDGYLLFITTSLSTYYLPKLSSLKTNSELKKEIFNGYKIILPVVLISCCTIFLFRIFIIKILFTPDFVKMENLFFWQLLGDFFKISAYILAYIMLAKAMTMIFIITEIVFSLSYVVFGNLLVNVFGLKGATMAFAFNYFAYLIVMLIIFKNLMLNKTNENIISG